MLPGRMSSWEGAVCFGAITETEDKAICVVTARRLVAALTRELIPAANRPIAMRAAMAAISQCILAGGLAFTGWISSERFVCVISFTRVFGYWLTVSKSRSDPDSGFDRWRMLKNV